MKVLLNQFDDPRLSERIFVGKGDIVFAKGSAVEFGFRKGKECEVQGIDAFGYLEIKNDNGVVDGYSVEYYSKHKPLS